jgi:hypothetical protein
MSSNTLLEISAKIEPVWHRTLSPPSSESDWGYIYERDQVKVVIYRKFSLHDEKVMLMRASKCGMMLMTAGKGGMLLVTAGKGKMMSNTLYS